MKNVTVMAYIDGRLVARESGYFSLDSMLERVERYLVETESSDFRRGV